MNLIVASNDQEREILEGAVRGLHASATGERLLVLGFENQVSIEFADQDEDVRLEGQRLTLCRARFVKSAESKVRAGVFAAITEGLVGLRHERASLMRDELSPSDVVLFEKLCVADRKATSLQVAWEMSRAGEQQAVGGIYLNQPKGALRHAAAVFAEAIERDAACLADGRARRMAVAAFISRPDVETIKLERDVLNAAWKKRGRRSGTSLERVVRLCFGEVLGHTYLADRRGSLAALQRMPYRRLRTPGAKAVVDVLELRA